MSAPVTDADRMLAEAIWRDAVALDWPGWALELDHGKAAQQIADDFAARLETETRLPTWREYSDLKLRVAELEGALREIYDAINQGLAQHAARIIERELGDEKVKLRP